MSGISQSNPKSKSIIAFVLAIAILVPALRTIPTIAPYFKSPAITSHGRSNHLKPMFAGVSGFHNYDTHQYLSYARQAGDSSALFMENPYTTEPQDGRFLILSTFFVGRLSKITGMSLPVAYTAASFLAGIVLFISLWLLSGVIFTGRKERICFYLLLAFSGGMEWVVELIKRGISKESLSSLDNIFSIDRGYSVFYWSQNGIWCMGMAAVVFSLWLLLKSPAESGKTFSPRVLCAGLVLALAFFLHPYSAIGGMGVIFLSAVWVFLSASDQNKSALWKTCLLVDAIAFVPILAYLLWARGDEVFRQMTDQGWIPGKSIGFWWYPLTYGGIFFLAAYGLKNRRGLKSKSRSIIFPWTAGFVVICSVPYFSGYKYQHLLAIPLAAFATLGYFRLSERLKSKSRAIILPAIWVLLCTGSVTATLMPVFKDMSYAARTYYYLEDSETKALKALEEAPDGNVLSSISTGKFIPWMTGKKVFAGHWFCTLNLKEKGEEVKGFFTPKTDLEAKKSLLKKNNIRYIYYGKWERLHKFNLDARLGLTPIYADENTIVLKVY